MSQNSSSAAPASKIKPILIAIAAALVVAAILYGVGLSKGRAELGAQKTAYDSQISGLNSQIESTKTELAASQNRARLQTARAVLFRTALALERRNFGTANTFLKESAATLAEVKNAENVDMTRLNALQKSIAQTNINVAVDLEGQRKEVLDFAAQLEKLTPAPETATMPAETEASAETETMPESAPAENAAE